MTVRELKEIISDFDDEDLVCYQVYNNIYKYVEFNGFEVKHPKNGKYKNKVILVVDKYLPNEWNG